MGRPVTLREHLPRLARALIRLARALIRACEEHGQPNSFAPSELEVEHGAPPARVQGRIGRDQWLMAALAEELAQRGWAGATKPVYAERRWRA